MFSKNFISKTLFFGILLLCVSCVGNGTEKEYKQIYTIEATDSSNFSVSLDGIETIKTPTFDLDGKWKLIENSTQTTKSFYLTFEGRKIYSTLNSDLNPNKKDNFQVFAIYDKCPDEDGTYNKNGNFLVIGSGDEKLTCYEVLSYEKTKITLYDIEKGGELEFSKMK